MIKALFLFLVFAVSASAQVRLRLNADDAIEASFMAGTGNANVIANGLNTHSSTALNANIGGTGFTSYTAGDLLYASSSSSLAKLASPLSASVLFSNGAGTHSWLNTIGTGNAVRAIAPTITTSLTLNGTLTGTGTGGHHELKATGSFVDNTLYLFNDSVTGGSKGYAALVLVRPTEAIGGNMFTFGFGPNVVGEYGNRGYLSTNPPGASPTTSPADIGIWQEQDNGSGWYQHRRIFCDGTNKTITLYGWANAAAAGTPGVYVDSSAAVGIGTATLATNAALTVNGHTKSLQRCFSVHKNGTAQTITAGVWTKVTFSTEKKDVGANFDNATNYRWTPTVAGVAELSAHVYFGSTTDGERLLISVRKNGSATEIALIEETAASTGGQQSLTIPTFYDDANGSSDYYELWAFRSVGTNIDGGAMNTQFNGKLH